MEVLECVLYQMWIALLVKIVICLKETSIHEIWFCLVVGPDIRPVLTSGSCHSELLVAG